MVLNDERTVADLLRRSWSADVEINIWDRLRLAGLIGAGLIEDDVDHDDRTDFAYRGHELKGMFVLIPGWLEAGYRWDVYVYERSQSGAEEELQAHTTGINFTPERHVRIQAQYKWKELDGPINPDLKDNLFMVTGQLRI
jgi:hypothetical protein